MSLLSVGESVYSSLDLVHKVLKTRGIPKRYWEAAFDDRDSKDLSLDRYFYGPVGSGKTWQLCSFVRAHSTKESCLFITIDDLLENIKSGFSYTFTNEEGEQVSNLFISKYKEVDVLAIDDLGSGLVTDWTKNIVYQVINHRYNNMLRTYISSNFSLDQLSQVFDERVSSRLAQMCQVSQLSKYRRSGGGRNR